MDTSSPDIAVRRNDEASRYELLVDGEVAGVADYRATGDLVVFPHTVIAPRLRGQGLGDVLVRHALDEVRRDGRKVVPRCWFVAEFIGEHPEYRALVAA